MSKASYQVIARRWRPKQFSQLVGQDHVVQTLGNAIDLGRIAHAYLFVGPRGTGKTTSARLFAKSLNWENGPSLEVPEDSEIGQSIMEGRCLDVIEIDGASNNSVEQVRDLRDECQYAPSQCRFKIYVIDEVHMLSQQAFNALLKTLEEPPPHVKFVFATTESHKVLPTIVSRCQRFEFRSIPTPLIVGKLKEICVAESIEIDDEALVAIARMAMGGMRDAQSILDQMISFCGHEIKQSDVLEVYGLASAQSIDDLKVAVLDGDYDSILKLSDGYSNAGLDFYRALLDLSECFRSTLVSSLSSNDSLYSPERIARILDELRDGESWVRSGLSEKSNFEVTLFRAVEAGRTRSIDHVIRKITQITPKDSKKKTPLVDQGNLKTLEVDKGLDLAAEPSTTEDLPEPQIHVEENSEPNILPKLSKDDQTASSISGAPQVSNEDTTISGFKEEADVTPPNLEKNSLQSTDPKQIKQRMEALPRVVREVVDQKFQGEYFAIEKIDRSKLI
jgi:DNA polymerase-3 subunit gamma/tau